jgi:ribose 5-phosphate isomerase B
MKIALGADHRGVDAVRAITQTLTANRHEMQLLGVCKTRSCDYPDMAYPVAHAVAAGKADRGILICGSGIGMSIAANKVKGIRAALVHDEVGAEVSRRHNDANVLCIPADMLGVRVIERIVAAWLRTEFEGGRHERRIQKIQAIEQGIDPSSTHLDRAAAVGE